MNYIGISAGFHDAALTVINNNGDITFASHSERYSKQKHDEKLCEGIINDAMQYTNGDYQLHYYERPLVKAIRQYKAKQKLGPFTMKSILGAENYLELNYSRNITNGLWINKHNHHKCHAAAGFQTSPFDKATVVIIDAIGELDTISIWNAHYDKKGKAKYKKVWGRQYPNSIGLFYSAMTHRVGLRPLDEEYILMGMAGYGNHKYATDIWKEFIADDLNFKQNLHIGTDPNFLEGADHMDIAASTQYVTEELIRQVMKIAQHVGHSDNLVYGGGVALNCLANRILGHYFENIWIMPNPGDAGNSLGAAALGYKKKVNWKDAFLGYEITGDYPIDKTIQSLLTDKIVGVANGKAEFGPRALGNRSLLADPRGDEIKDKVNEIKRRQKFRPFAPIILEEHVNDYFDMPINWNESRYMQVIADCKYPDKFPAIAHVDNTSRVQTVPNDGSGIRRLLEEWYKITDCPMLLNTSLNIRGEPMVNDISDAIRFQEKYDVPVHTSK